MSNKRRRLRVKAEPDNFKRQHKDNETFILRAQEDVVLREGAVVVVKTGVHLEIPVGHTGLVSISDNQGKTGIALSNGVGIIDARDRKEVELSLISYRGDRTIFKEDEIAKVVVIPLRPVNPQYVKTLKGSD